MRSRCEYVRLLTLDNIYSNEFDNWIANCDILDRFAATLNPAYNSLLILLDVFLAIVSKLTS